jgi:hypothetical protein
MDQNKEIEESLRMALADCSSLCKKMLKTTASNQEEFRKKYEKRKKDMASLDQKATIVIELLKAYESSMNSDPSEKIVIKSNIEQGLAAIKQIQISFKEAGQHCGCNK